jgi:hypothetical protein
VPVHYEGLWNQLELGEDGVEEHLSLCLVTVENGQRVQLDRFAAGWQAEKSGPNTGAGAAGAGVGSGFCMPGNSRRSIYWMVASLFMLSEAGSEAEALETSGCAVPEAGSWSIGTEEGLRFEVGEDGALE